MDLKQYFDKYLIDPLEFALKAGISVSAVYLYLKGKKTGSRKTALEIEKLTKGEVSFQEIYKKKGSI